MSSDRKYLILIPEGAPDEPLQRLEGRTALQAANTPHLDALAREGRLGTTDTIPKGCDPATEIGLLSILGYDPAAHPAGRAAIEARYRGIPLNEHEVVFRCDLVAEQEDSLYDFTAGFISTAEAQSIIDALNASPLGRSMRFHVGAGYRNYCVYHDRERVANLRTCDPQELRNALLSEHLPTGAGSEILIEARAEAAAILAASDVNTVRIDLGEPAATGIWFWGEGPDPELPAFSTRFEQRGAMIGGTDLPRGLASLIGWEIVEARGATGLPDTDYAGKAAAAIAALDRYDLVCTHVQAPDVAAHLGDENAKIAALEAFDAKIVGPVAARLRKERDWRLLVISSHATITETGRHSDGATILLLAGAGIESHRGEAFDEQNAGRGELPLEGAHDLMEYFLRR